VRKIDGGTVQARKVAGNNIPAAEGKGRRINIGLHELAITATRQ